MKHRQRGISLIWVVILTAGVALVLMVGLMSMRHETNYFAQGMDKALKAMPGSVKAAASAATAAAAGPAPGSGPLRSCVIGGKKVISNTECTAANKTSRVLEIHDTHGIEAPKEPPKEEAAKGGDPMLDKVIDRQVNGR